jgi:hypothetical protein
VQRIFEGSDFLNDKLAVANENRAIEMLGNHILSPIRRSGLCSGMRPLSVSLQAFECHAFSLTWHLIPLGPSAAARVGRKARSARTPRQRQRPSLRGGAPAEGECGRIFRDGSRAGREASGARRGEVP